MLENAKGFLKNVKSKTILFFGDFQNFVNDSKEKFKNLYQTNYQTGMYHLEHGNLWDATLRFKIIKRFWPNKLEAQYQYAICLILQGMKGDAILLLNDILKKDQNYIEAQILLEDLKNERVPLIIEEYKAKFNKNNEEETAK
ncbi:MAG: hypothetical protein PHY80_02870 [Rickettsiales bacterium]|nr:hypothetical protein [Rickettsiales bacterium]